MNNDVRIQIDVMGFVNNTKIMKHVMTPLTVNYTADSIGKTLSIGNDYTGIQYTIPFDAVYEIIKEKEKNT